MDAKIERWQDAIQSLGEGHITTNADVQRFMQAEIDALRDLLRSAEKGQWQPIETAPKDGRPLLMASPYWRMWSSDGWHKDAWTGRGQHNAPKLWQALPPAPEGAPK